MDQSFRRLWADYMEIVASMQLPDIDDSEKGELSKLRVLLEEEIRIYLCRQRR